MGHKHCQNYLDIYAKNVGIVKMAVFFRGDKITCRCIIWIKEGKNYYDRIYAISDDINRTMQACLEQMGYINISQKNIITPNYYRKLSIELLCGEHSMTEYPYMDTMAYICNKTLTNDGDNGYTELQETDGTSSASSPICDCCGDSCDEDDLYTIGGGSHEGERMCTDCCSFSEFHEETLANSDAIHTDHDGFILRNERILFWNGEDGHEDSAIELYNGKLAHRDDDIYEDIDGNKFVEGDENFEEIEGKWYNINSKEYAEQMEAETEGYNS